MLSPFPQFPTDPNDFDIIFRQVLQKVEKSYNPLSIDDFDESTITDFMDNFG